jgi:hypothetical protein
MSKLIRSVMCGFGAVALVALSAMTGKVILTQDQSAGVKSFQIACNGPGERRCATNVTAVRG